MRILVLEDEKNTASIICEYLECEGYDVVLTDNGDKALQILQNEKIDFGIFDINVYGLSGLDLLKYIKTNDTKLPVMILSSIDDEFVQEKAFDYYADDYITKPFSVKILMKRVKAVVRRYEMIKDNDIKGLYLDNDSYTVYYNGNNLDFTVTEFMLFQKLYENKQKVFTRDELLDVVYDKYNTSSDRVIDAHVKNIRKKLPSSEIIKTVIGVGYRMGEYDE